MNPDGTSGMIEASTTCRRSVPWTRPRASTTAPSSGDGPMAQVPTTCGIEYRFARIQSRNPAAPSIAGTGPAQGAGSRAGPRRRRRAGSPQPIDRHRTPRSRPGGRSWVVRRIGGAKPNGASRARLEEHRLDGEGRGVSERVGDPQHQVGRFVARRGGTVERGDRVEVRSFPDGALGRRVPLPRPDGRRGSRRPPATRVEQERRPRAGARAPRSRSASGSPGSRTCGRRAPRDPPRPSRRSRDGPLPPGSRRRSSAKSMSVSRRLK